MNTYFLQMQRRKTKSNLKVHIEANDDRDAQTFAHRQLNTDTDGKCNWICWNVVKIKCPNVPYEEYKGHRIWIDAEKFVVLQPGELKCIVQKLKHVSIDNVKTYIDNEFVSV